MKILKYIGLYFVAFSYLLVSTGFGLKVHYCHDDITSISYIVLSPECACDEELSELDCCSTEEKFYQFQEESLVKIEQSLDSEITPWPKEIDQYDRKIINDESNFLYKEVIDIQAPKIYLIKSAFIHYG